MNTVCVRNVVIGQGRPKICVPLMGRTETEIFREASHIAELPADVVEWRADWFEEASNTEQVVETGRALRTVLADSPLLFTFRTAKEGGEKAISPDAYQALNEAVIKSGFPDLVDAELFSGDEIVQKLIAQAHARGVKVIVSSHDFSKTPSKEELVRRLRRMQELGADLPKLAVMPTCREDVLTLLAATLEMSEKYADRPIITMSMSGTGIVSRVSGELFGSALTFGSAGRASAPGQLPAEELRQVLEILHEGNGSL